MALLLPKLSKSSGSSVRVHVWRQRRASVAPIGRVFPKAPDIAKKPDQTLDLTTIGLSDKQNLLFPVVGNDRIPPRPMDYKKIYDQAEENCEDWCTAPNLPELPGLPSERRGHRPPNTEPPDFCLKGEGQRNPRCSYISGTSKIENSPGGVALKGICSQLQPWFDTMCQEHRTDVNVQEDLKRLLYIKKMRIYLEVRKMAYSPEVHCLPIFHCPLCLEHWTLTGWAPENCPNTIQPTRGPEVVMHGTKMRFIYIHPKGNTLNRRNDYARKISDSSKPPHLSSREKEIRDYATLPHPAAIRRARALSPLLRGTNEGIGLHDETAEASPCANPTGEKEHDIKEGDEEGVEMTLCTSAVEHEGISKSKASMSLLNSISFNDDHYNEYARSSSRNNGKTNEWKRRSSTGRGCYTHNTKTVSKTSKHMPLFPGTSQGEEKWDYSHCTLTSKPSNASLNESQAKSDDEEECQEDSNTKDKVETKTSDQPEHEILSKYSDMETPTLLRSQDLPDTVKNKTEIPQVQNEDQVNEHERKQDKTLTKIEVSNENEDASLSSFGHKEKESTRENEEAKAVSVSKDPTLKQTSAVETKYTSRGKNNVSWYDRRARSSRDKGKGPEKVLKQKNVMHDPSPITNDTSHAEVHTNTKRTSLPTPTDHFKEAQAVLKNTEAQRPKPENQVIKRYLNKSRPQVYQHIDSYSQAGSSVPKTTDPLGKRPIRDSVTRSRDHDTSTGLSDDSSSIKTPDLPMPQIHEPLAIDGAQEKLTLSHRRRTEELNKKERKIVIKRPARAAYHSKKIVSGLNTETSTTKPQTCVKPHVPEAARLSSAQQALKNPLNDNYVYSPAALPSGHAHEWIKIGREEIEDEFRTVVGDIRNDIEVVDLEIPSPITPTVNKGLKFEAHSDSDEEEFFEEVDSKTSLFSKGSREIHRLPVSNAFTFSFYELPKQYMKYNKRIEMSVIKSRSGRERRQDRRV